MGFARGRHVCLSLLLGRHCWRLLQLLSVVALFVVIGNGPRLNPLALPQYPLSGDVLRYLPPRAAGYRGEPGRAFNVTEEYIATVGLPFTDFVTLNDTTLANFVFALAASKTHYHESLDAVASIQTYFPDRRIYYYDIGLLDRQVKKVKLWCNVVYRTFNFTQFPEHFSSLKTYGWKAMLVKELFADYAGVLWMDASTRIHSSNMSTAFQFVRANGGVMMAKKLFHANHATMHPTSYSYLPSNWDRQRETRQCCTTSFLLYKTREVYWNILHWWFLCALDNNCMAPVGKSRCTTSMVRRPYFFGCHRYDQVTLNVLDSNYYNYRPDDYCLSKNPFFLKIQRRMTTQYQLQTCPLQQRLQQHQQQQQQQQQGQQQWQQPDEDEETTTKTLYTLQLNSTATFL